MPKKTVSLVEHLRTRNRELEARVRVLERRLRRREPAEALLLGFTPLRRHSLMRRAVAYARDLVRAAVLSESDMRWLGDMEP